MMNAIADKIHHFFYAAAITIVGVAIIGVWGYVELHRPPALLPSATSAAPSRVDQLEREVQAVGDADRVLAAARGTVPQLAAPAVTVVRDIPGLSGFSPAQVAQILSGLKAPTREVIGANLAGPKPSSTPTSPPGWTDAQTRAIYDADVAATEAAIAKSHIAVTVSREEVEPTRVGSIFTPDGSGLGFAALRHKHFEFDIGAIVRGSHLSPVIAPSYLIPHTAVAIGPFAGYDRQLLYGVAATVHF